MVHPHGHAVPKTGRQMASIVALALSLLGLRLAVHALQGPLPLPLDAARAEPDRT